VLRYTQHTQSNVSVIGIVLAAVHLQYRRCYLESCTIGSGIGLDQASRGRAGIQTDDPGRGDRCKRTRPRGPPARTDDGTAGRPSACASAGSMHRRSPPRSTEVTGWGTAGDETRAYKSRDETRSRGGADDLAAEGAGRTRTARRPRRRGNSRPLPLRGHMCWFGRLARPGPGTVLAF
jgi:hypothetical protein